jgi:hypothetical protein
MDSGLRRNDTALVDGLVVKPPQNPLAKPPVLLYRPEQSQQR